MLTLCKFYIIIIIDIAYNKIGVDNMATKSFLKSITIRNRKDAERFVNALENAEKKKAKKVKLDKMVEEVKDSEQIRKIFGNYT